MALAADLLAQAAHLATLDPTKPKQANIRRSISAAYYALFHFLIAEAIRVIVRDDPAGLRAKVACSFQHGTMADVCRTIAGGGSSTGTLRSLMPSGFGHAIKRIARTFTELQEARQIADYDLSSSPTRADALGYIKSTEEAFTSWRELRDTAEANVFLYALLLSKQWSR